MRGKVMGLLEALTGGLVPIGMALGGLLGEFLPLRLVIILAFALSGAVAMPPLLAPSIRGFFGGKAQGQTEAETP
jgi:DHA3 family macrolide efflux protein-like MFS transporter